MAFDIEQFPTSKEAKRMLTFVTRDFYDRSYVGKWLFQVMGLEMDEIREHLDELTAQIFPETATWGLRYHEEKWGLPVYTGENYEERRRAVLAKRDYRAPMMPFRMEQYLQDMTDYTVRIADIHDPGPKNWQAPHPNSFRVYFIGDADSATLDPDTMKRLIDRIKQSHTDYEMEQVIEIDIDSSDLEQIRLPRITMHLDIPFRSNIVFDGDWPLDGRFLLNQGLGSRMGVHIASSIRIQNPDNGMQIPKAGIRIAVKGEEEIKATQGIGLQIAFWEARLLDGLWILDGSYTLDSKRRYGMGIKDTSRIGITNTESIDNATVTRFTRDYRYLDGELRLDGERHLNSIYEKEEIE